MNTWRAAAAERRRHHQIERKVLGRLRSIVAASALGRWVENHAQLKRARRVVLRLKNRRVHSLFQVIMMHSYDAHAAP